MLQVAEAFLPHESASEFQLCMCSHCSVLLASVAQQYVTLTDETSAQGDQEVECQAAAAEPEAARRIRYKPIATSK